MLEGHRVLDFATVGPAARASRWLADYGAEVVKIGAPPSQAGVQIDPPFFAYSGHRGMKRVRLDLKSDAGRDAFLRLADEADVIIESFRPGVVDRLGIGYDAVRERNPRIVYCSTSGYGQDGPKASWAGHDLNYLAAGGYLDCSGRDEEDGPALPGATIGDAAGGGMHAVMSILAALLQRERTGAGTHLDVSVADGVLALMSLYVDEHLATGAVPGPRHDLLTGRYACYDVYECRDGRWLSVAAIEPRFFANLCAALHCEELAEHQTDDAWQDEIREEFEETFLERDRDDWVAELGPADCCVAAVASVPEVVNDEHFAARGAFLPATHPDAGEFRQVAPVLAGQPREDRYELRPSTETDTEELLTGVGFDVTEIEDLREKGVVA